MAGQDGKNLRKPVANAMVKPSNAFDPQTQQSVVAEGLTNAVIDGKIPPLSAQQIKFITWLQQGLTYQVAARAVGTPVETALEWSQDPRVQQAMAYADTLRQASVIVTRDMLTLMLLEERAMADTSTAAITAIREIGRLNGLYPEQKVTRPGITVDGTAETAGADGKTPAKGAGMRKKMEAATDEELLAMGGVTYDLEPESRGQSYRTSDHD